MASNTEQQVLEILRNGGGFARTREILCEGIHPRILYRMRDQGKIEQIRRGLYALPNLPEIGDLDLAFVAKQVPLGVICLLSALSYHHLTTQIPREIWIAVPRNYKPPKVSYPPVQYSWLTGLAFTLGIERHDIGGVEVAIYSREKTIVDCFRLRNKVGLDIAIEALQTYWKSAHTNPDLLIDYAKKSHIYRVMKPYLEMTINGDK